MNSNFALAKIFRIYHLSPRLAMPVEISLEEIINLIFIKINYV